METIFFRFHQKLSHAQRSFSGNRYSDHVGLVVVNQKYIEQSDYGPQAESTFCKNLFYLLILSGNHYSLAPTILAMTRDAKKQLHGVFLSSGFPEECFVG